MGDTLWQLELDDTSPSISYSPFPDTFSSPNLAAGWNPYYDLSGFAPSPGAIGTGASSHITSKDGASLTVQWRGTGIQLYGNTTQASFSVTLNSTALNIAKPSSNPPSISGSGLLADINGLPDGDHTLTFTAIISSQQIPLNASMIVFDKAVLRTSIPSPATNITYKLQNIDSTSIAFSGQWASVNASSTAPYRVSHTAGDRASTRFNGTSFTLQGSTSSDGANFSVTLDGVKTSLSARSSFNVENTTLFFAHGLNSTMEHSIDLSNDSGGKLSLLADGLATIVPSAPPPLPSPAAATSNNSSFSTGAVAALTLAGVLAFLLLTSTFLYFCVYRRRRRKSGGLPMIYSFSRPGSGGKGSHGSRRQKWHQGLVPRTLKQQEAGVTGYDDVLDIGSGAMDSKEDLADIDEVTRESTVVHEKQGSRGKGDKRGFAKWRREAVDGNIRGIGLPILFRHSDAQTSPGGARTNDDEASPQDTYESGRRYSHVRGASDESSDSSSQRRYIAMANLRNKGKARQITGAGSSPDMSQHTPTTKRSWSPSFRLALPIPSPSKPSTSKFKWNIPGTSKQRSQEPSVASTQSAGLPPSPGAHQGHLSMQSGQDQVSSFIAASDPSPVATRKRIVDSLQPVRPPSYNDSQRDSSSSSNVLSIPRSVSHSGSGSPVQLTYPRAPLHQHQDSRNVLLREGGPSKDDPLTTSPNVMASGLSPSATTSTSYPMHDIERLPDSTQPPSLTLSIPSHTRQQESSESPGQSSPRAPPSLGQAIRGLSPRTTERGAASASGTSLGLGLLYPSARQSVQTQASNTLSIASTSDGSSSPVEFARNVLPSGVPLAMQSTVSIATHAAEESQGGPDEHRSSEPVQLDLRAMSPFQVDFDWRSVRTRTNISHSSADDTPAAYLTAPSRHSRASQSSSDFIPPLPTGPSFVQGSSRVPFRLTTSTMASAPPGAPSMSSDLVTSFLDLTSSREGSVRTKSLRTVASNEKIFGDGSVPPVPGMQSQEPRSRWSNTTVPSFNTRRFTGVTKESSGDSEAEHSSGSNTFPIPVNMTLPPSPHHVMDFPEGSEPRRSFTQTSRSSGPPAHIHPILDLESPTDSVPRTVSDIHFRQNDPDDMPKILPRQNSAPFANRFLRPLPESPDEENFSRPPLPQISMLPPAQPQSPAESPSVTRPRPLPTPPVARLNVSDNPNLRTQLDS